MDRLTLNVVNTLLDWVADLVGIAPAEHFADAPESNKPTDFLPECKSVISIAMLIFRGKCLHQCPSNRLTANEMKDYVL